MTHHNTTLSLIELEKAKHTIDQFLYSCSHSLRSPLKSVEGLLKLLRLNILVTGSEETQSLVKALEDSVSKMDSTLMEMHEFLQNSTERIHMKPVSISELVSETLSAISESAIYKKSRVSVNVVEEVAIYTDVERMRVALKHLLINALTYVDGKKTEHAVNVSIRVNELRARISISDNGTGINEKVLPRIFDLFFRGSVESRGAGVGLYLVKEIMKKLDGNIEVASTEGEGSTFTISVPCFS